MACLPTSGRADVTPGAGQDIVGRPETLKSGRDHHWWVFGRLLLCVSVCVCSCVRACVSGWVSFFYVCVFVFVEGLVQLERRERTNVS